MSLLPNEIEIKKIVIPREVESQGLLLNEGTGIFSINDGILLPVKMGDTLQAGNMYWMGIPMRRVMVEAKKI